VRQLIGSAKDVWKAYVTHEFVQQLGRGTLRRECFVHFLKFALALLLSLPAVLLTQSRQDYLYLKYYARAHG
jgi:hydroxymethylpyrimidine/phosphomethylpyrimidine kinase